MKASELRIGNHVRLCFEHKAGWVNAKVTDIYNDGTIDTDCDEVIEGKKYYFEGISLTEEWLLRFGFHEKYKSTSNRWLKHAEKINAHLELHDCEDDNGKLKGVFYYDYNLEVLYVHQLMNLYFAVTGEELHVNIEVES